MSEQQPLSTPQVSTSGLSASQLPAPQTLLVGRENEVNTIIEMLRNPTVGLVTLTGLGGAGKTQLALAVAHRLESQFKDGACFVQLAPIENNKMDLLSTVARAINVSVDVGDEPAAPLLNHLALRELLLVLDNYEHLVEQTELLTQIRQYAPNVTVLITSRIRLNLVSETTYVVTGLELPPANWTPTESELSDANQNTSEPPSAQSTYGSVDLFLGIAKRLQPAFLLRADNAAAIARICHLAAGSPLGLELAAAWTRMLSPHEIVTELESSLDFLTTSATDRPERQRNMRHIFDYSWTLLSVEEQRSMMRLTIFRGGFDRAAAKKVAQTSLTVLAELIDKSLLQRTGMGRYILHELVHQFATNKSAEATAVTRVDEGNPESSTPNDRDSMTELANAHAAYYLDQLREIGDTLSGPQGKEWLPKLRVDDENIQQAWHYAILNGPIEMLKANVGSAMPYYWVNGWSAKIRQMLHSAIERLERQIGISSLTAIEIETLEVDMVFQNQIEVLIWLTIERALTFNHHGRYRETIELVEPTIRIAEFLEQPDLLIQAYTAWGGALLYLSDPAARAPLLRAQEIAQTANLLEHEATLLGMLGIAYFKQNQFEQAFDCYEQALIISRQQKNWREEGLNLVSMGWLLERMGEFERAQVMNEQGLSICEKMDYPPGAGRALQGLGTVAIALGNLYDADQMHSRAITIGQQLQDPQREAANRYFLGRVAFRSGNQKKARRNLEIAIDIAKGIDDHLSEGLALAHLGYIETEWGNRAKAQGYLEQALSIAQRLDNTEIIYMSYQGLGWLLLQQKQPAAAAKYFEQELQLMQQWNQAYATIDAQTGLAQAALDQGFIEQAKELATPLFAFIESGHLHGTTRIANTLFVCYQLLLTDQPEDAATMLQTARDTLHKIAANFSNEAQRHDFLHNISLHHKICTAADSTMDPQLEADVISVL